MAIAANQPVVARAADQQRVFGVDRGKGTHLRHTQGRVTKDEFLDIRDPVDALCRNDDIDIPVPGDGEIVAGHAETRLIEVIPGIDRVVASAACERVIAIAGADRVIASAGPDRVIAIAGKDHIVAPRGPDRVSAMAGLDRVSAIAGPDRVSAIAGPDPVVAIAGPDRVSAIAGIDRVIAIAGPDFVIAIAGPDPVVAIAGPDRVSAIAGPDRIVAIAGLDRVIAIPGKDRVIVIPGKDRVIAAAGRDRVIARTGVDQVVAITSPDRVIAGAGIDRVITVGADQRLVGGPGKGIHLRSTQGRVPKDELLDIRDPVGALRRNDGIDISVFGNGDIADGYAETRLIKAGTAVETVMADTAVETVIAIAGIDRVIVIPGKDRVVVIAGKDRVVAIAGPDRVIASAGKDRVIVIPGRDRIMARAGVDQVVAIAGIDRVIAIVADQQLVGGPGTGIHLPGTQGRVGKDELLDIPDRIGTLRRNDGIDVCGLEDGEISAGHAETRPIIADTAINRIIASAGPDRIVAIAGRDRVIAIPGKDRVIVIAGKDRVIAAAGRDRVIARTGVDQVVAITSPDRVIAGAGNDRVITVGADQRLVGGPGKGIHLRSTQGRVAKDELLDIRGRIDTLRRNDGIDISFLRDAEIADGHAETRLINAPTAVDTVIAGAGNDRVIAIPAIDRVMADTGIDPVAEIVADDGVIARAAGEMFNRGPGCNAHSADQPLHIRKVLFAHVPAVVRHRTGCVDVIHAAVVKDGEGHRAAAIFAVRQGAVKEVTQKSRQVGPDTPGGRSIRHVAGPVEVLDRENIRHHRAQQGRIAGICPGVLSLVEIGHDRHLPAVIAECVVHAINGSPVVSTLVAQTQRVAKFVDVNLKRIAADRRAIAPKHAGPHVQFDSACREPSAGRKRESAVCLVIHGDHLTRGHLDKFDIRHKLPGFHRPAGQLPTIGGQTRQVYSDLVGA